MLPSGTKIDLQRAEKNLLRAVASFEFAKGVFVLLIGLSAILLVHKDAWVIAESLLALFHVNTDRRWAQDFLDFADRLTEARFGRWRNSRSPILSCALLRPMACGKQRTWAEWLAFISGTLFLPLEIHGLMRGITVLRSTRVRGEPRDRPLHAFLAAGGAASAGERANRLRPESLDQSGK